MATLMSERKYAAHRGVSQRAVQKAVESGRITKVVDPVTKKLKIDPAIADAQWIRNTDVEQQLRGNGGVLPIGPAAAAATRPGDAQGGGIEHEPADDEVDGDREELLRHKTAGAKADAQLKTMAALERAGDLVSAEDVEREFTECARSTRNAMLAIPDRVAQVLDPNNPERARKLLENEIKKALRDVNTRLEERAASAADREETLQ